VHVYIVDTGIAEHASLDDRVVRTVDFVGSRRGVVCKSGDHYCARDYNGHGTHIAGTIAGRTIGIARAATVHAMKICNFNGRCRAGGFVKALDWVIKHGQRPAIVSASIGGYGRSKLEERMIDKTRKSGIAVVVAAGNSHKNACSYSPAFVRSAITVGSTNNKARVSRFSNYGSCVDILAPGERILSASHRNRRGTRRMTGTSMATPHVTGVLAAMISKYPDDSVDEVVERMMNTATIDVVTGSLYEAPNKFLYISPHLGSV